MLKQNDSIWILIEIFRLFILLDRQNRAQQSSEIVISLKEMWSNLLVSFFNLCTVSFPRGFIHSSLFSGKSDSPPNKNNTKNGKMASGEERKGNERSCISSWRPSFLGISRLFEADKIEHRTVQIGTFLWPIIFREMLRGTGGIAVSLFALIGKKQFFFDSFVWVDEGGGNCSCPIELLAGNTKRGGWVIFPSFSFSFQPHKSNALLKTSSKKAQNILFFSLKINFWMDYRIRNCLFLQFWHQFQQPMEWMEKEKMQLNVSNLS